MSSVKARASISSGWFNLAFTQMHSRSAQSLSGLQTEVCLMLSAVFIHVNKYVPADYNDPS